jgi:hypothetical protein
MWLVFACDNGSSGPGWKRPRDGPLKQGCRRPAATHGLHPGSTKGCAKWIGCVKRLFRRSAGRRLGILGSAHEADSPGTPHRPDHPKRSPVGIPVQVIARRQLVEAFEVAGTQLAAYPVLLTQPPAEVQQAASVRAEWSGRPGKPRPPSTTMRAGHLRGRGARVHRFSQRRMRLSTRLNTRQVTMGTWNENPGRSITRSPGRPPRDGCHHRISAPRTINIAPTIISCFPSTGPMRRTMPEPRPSVQPTATPRRRPRPPPADGHGP